MPLLILCLLYSCTFGKGGDGGLSDTVPLGFDSDGDLMDDRDEAATGRNPHIADIPDIRIRFLQNYAIRIEYEESTLEGTKEKTLVIDTKLHRNDPYFRYRIGRVFIRDASFKRAASIGRFDSHSWGEIKEHDLSWVGYPEVDPRFYADKVLKYGMVFENKSHKILSSSIVLENSVRLREYGRFSEIAKLSLNFYYYDYKNEKYELLKKHSVDRHFQAGIEETFEVALDDIPLDIISQNYLKKGEFIISEIDDYEIPGLGTTYKTLMASVKAKSVPVFYDTPLESWVSYVAAGEGGIGFVDILRILFVDKAAVKEDRVHKIGEFESNIPDYTHLDELEGYDKNGRWFVFTNKLRRHFLDHRFSPGDTISLSYVTGDVLARQASEKITSYHKQAATSTVAYPLGNASRNSRIHIQIKPLRKYGEKPRQWADTIVGPPSCGKNCAGFDAVCHFKFNIFEPGKDDLVFDDDLGTALGGIFLVVNGDELPLDRLLEEGRIDAERMGENIHITVRHIGDIKESPVVGGNVLGLKILPEPKTTFNGIFLSGWSGKDWSFCPYVAMDIAGRNKWPLSSDSKDFEIWKGAVNWNIIERGDTKTYFDAFSVGISGTIINYFN